MPDKFVTRREFREYQRITKRALRLQAKEYERRLKNLNGEAKRLAKFLKSTISKRAFEDFKKLLDERVGALRKAEDQRQGGMILVRILASAGALGLLISVLNALGVRFG